MSFLLRVEWRVWTALLLGWLLALDVGCDRGRVSESSEGPSTEELVSYYSPQSIKILPFTKARSFDEDAIPDGLGVSIRTLDAAGDPVKAYGTFVFELYGYRPGVSDHRGELLHTWTQPITSPKDQKQYWERVTTTYEFQLSWEGQPIEPQKKYILTATLQAPGAKRLFDEYEFEFRVSRKEILDNLTQPKP
jgi:hypothetical protein